MRRFWKRLLKLIGLGEKSWRERGEQRGRTVQSASWGGGGTMTATAAPEASLSIKVTRADGTVEEYEG